jgi:hypothetical protein
MAIRKAIVFGFGLVGLMVISLVISLCFFGGFKMVKLGVYLVGYKDKQSMEYGGVVQEFSGIQAENQLSGFYVGYFAHRICLWDAGRPSVHPEQFVSNLGAGFELHEIPHPDWAAW